MPKDDKKPAKPGPFFIAAALLAVFGTGFVFGQAASGQQRRRLR